MVDPWLTEERRALRELVAAFTEREIVPHLPAWERDGEVPRDLHRKAAAVGLLGVAYPAEVGGGGCDAVDGFLVAEQIILSGGSGGLVAALLTHGIALPHIVETGDPALIDRFVRPTLGGMGYVREHEVERHYRDARVLGIGGGTNEIMNEIIWKLL